MITDKTVIASEHNIHNITWLGSETMIAPGITVANSTKNPSQVAKRATDSSLKLNLVFNIFSPI